MNETTVATALPPNQSVDMAIILSVRRGTGNNKILETRSWHSYGPRSGSVRGIKLSLAVSQFTLGATFPLVPHVGIKFVPSLHHALPLPCS